MRLTREKVYDIITREAEYAKKYDIPKSSAGRIKDSDKNLETWLLWMEQYIAEARKEATIGYDKYKASGYLRQALSIGVNAAMYLGLPERFIEDEAQVK